MLTDSQWPVHFWLHFMLLILCPSLKPKDPFQCVRRLTTSHLWVSVPTAVSVVTMSNVEHIVKILITQINTCRSGVWVFHVTMQFGFFWSASFMCLFQCSFLLITHTVFRSSWVVSLVYLLSRSKFHLFNEMQSYVPSVLTILNFNNYTVTSRLIIKYVLVV